ncbi:hypothetical protein V7S43_003122 [Phytophthora oleae]|uniref:Uncharacterized protein n=1 Tax=Phytophthora oleae TaxID=2107226 RepID=A0ABD3G389_9STRA
MTFRNQSGTRAVVHARGSVWPSKHAPGLSEVKQQEEAEIQLNDAANASCCYESIH